MMHPDVKVPLDSASWQAGFNTGKAGKSSRIPSGIKDRMAWYSGYIEGQASRPIK
jgi:hypothetical protein